jgi:nucleoside-diphosphate-sugar epimerase
MDRTALIGSTGFVGSALAQQLGFSENYHSRNISDLDGSYSTVYCAAAPGKKWLANKNPQEDWRSINALLEALGRIKATNFILISTVDVFSFPVGVDESSQPDLNSLLPYGLHRLRLEDAVRSQFDRSLVIRLPGLVGPGLKKNVVFDLHNSNNLAAVDSRAMFQFYPIKNLSRDIAVGLESGISLLHLTAEPTSVGDISEHGFGAKFRNEVNDNFPVYDFRSAENDLFGGTGPYQYSADDVYSAVREFHKTEPRARVDGRL